MSHAATNLGIIFKNLEVVNRIVGQSLLVVNVSDMEASFDDRIDDRIDEEYLRPQ